MCLGVRVRVSPRLIVTDVNLCRRDPLHKEWVHVLAFEIHKPVAPRKACFILLMRIREPLRVLRRLVNINAYGYASALNNREAQWTLDEECQDHIASCQEAHDVSLVIVVAEDGRERIGYCTPESS